MLDFSQRVLGLSRGYKVATQVLVDLGLIIACFIAAMAVRLESFVFFQNTAIWLPLGIAGLGAIVTFRLAGLYRSLVRFISDQILSSIIKGVLVYAALLFAVNQVLIAGVPRSVPIISGVFLILAITGTRFLVRWIFRRPMQIAKKPVVIYGAGEAGHELLNSLRHGREYAPIAFVDDQRSEQGLTVSGLPVYSPDSLDRLARETDLQVVLLAMPNITQKRRLAIFSSLEALQLEVKTIPGMSDIVSGKASISELRNISAEDLLGRDSVNPDELLLQKNNSGKVVMITGAGGSIGSELCLQILEQRPAQLILFELSEFALYTIEARLMERAAELGIETAITPILGSVQNRKRLEAAVTLNGVQTIYHAAAYKHVPLVEDNVVEGILNNAFGTLNVARIARDRGVENFILISTDKAVRPTNVMGATKRISELVCQALAHSGSETVFSMVRFGNVLGSSGSVIPRFRAQIQAGGPITVTHRDINRYFMTIPEASQLVIQAGAMAKGGDVYVLDMGEPVKIVDLAETMVRLHGLKPYFLEKDQDHDLAKGDIPIVFTGLRKGEKLYEELLIGDLSEPTQHPRILSASERFVPLPELLATLAKLSESCERFDLAAIHALLLEMPLDYRPSGTSPKARALQWNAADNGKEASQPEQPVGSEAAHA